MAHRGDETLSFVPLARHLLRRRRQDDATVSQDEQHNPRHCRPFSSCMLPMLHVARAVVSRQLLQQYSPSVRAYKHVGLGVQNLAYFQTGVVVFVNHTSNFWLQASVSLELAAYWHTQTKLRILISVRLDHLVQNINTKASNSTKK